MSRLLAGALVVFLLAGCSAVAPEVEGESSPKPTVNPALIVCNDFETATSQLAYLLIEVWGGDATEAQETELAAFPDVFDALSLRADGELATRLADVRDVLPGGVLPVMMNPDPYFDSLAAVNRACVAEGSDSDYTTWES